MGLIILYSCKDSMKIKHYNVVIDYSLDETLIADDKISKDLIYIFFEYNYVNDTMNIYNKTNHFETIYLNTDATIGYADYKAVLKSNTNGALYFTLNNSPKFGVFLDSLKSNMISIRQYGDSLIYIKTLSKTPAYD
jgi:hypothetical protein